MKALDFAVVGLGRFGTSLARTLVRLDHTVLGIDRDPTLTQRYSHEFQTVALDSTDEEALREIGIDEYANVVVAIGDNFEASLMSCVALKSVGVRHVICKASTVVHRDILRKVGVDRVVLPEHEAGERLGHELSNPDLLQQLELTPSATLAEVRIPSIFEGNTLKELALKSRHGVQVVALVREFVVHAPAPESLVLKSSDRLIVLGSLGKLAQLGALE